MNQLLLEPQSGELTLNGAFGEGGGQILRTAVALAAAQRLPLRIHNIRARRSKPGLQAQHRQAVLALGEICHATLDGAQIGSSSLRLGPGRPVRTGTYRFDIHTAGSTPLLLHALLPALVMAQPAGGSSEVELIGGTHVPTSPSAGYLRDVWAVAARRCGIAVEVELVRPGFYPRGGGQLRATISAGRPALDLDFTERLGAPRVRARAGVANVPAGIGERLLLQVARRLRAAGVAFDIEEDGAVLDREARSAAVLDREARSAAVIDHGREALSPGVYLELLLEGEPLPAGFVALGARGVPAEAVADRACDELLRHLERGAPVDPHLADQLLLLLALSVGAGGSRFRTSEVTEHLLTHAEVLRALWPVSVAVEGALGQPGTVEVRQRG